MNSNKFIFIALISLLAFTACNETKENNTNGDTEPPPQLESSESTEDLPSNLFSDYDTVGYTRAFSSLDSLHTDDHQEIDYISFIVSTGSNTENGNPYNIDLNNSTIGYSNSADTSVTVNIALTESTGTGILEYGLWQLSTTFPVTVGGTTFENLKAVTVIISLDSDEKDRLHTDSDGTTAP